MHVTLVYVDVKPEHIDAFIEACRFNHQQSVCEAGNRRFDILLDSAEPTQFVLYEAYASAEAAAEHKTTQHYLAWRNTVAHMMRTPRRGVNYNGLFPQG